MSIVRFVREVFSEARALERKLSHLSSEVNQ
jgi:hypothetical protein